QPARVGGRRERRRDSSTDRGRARQVRGPREPPLGERLARARDAAPLSRSNRSWRTFGGVQVLMGSSRIPWLLLALLAPGLAAAQPVQLVHAFAEAPGFPQGGLVLTPDGSLYGTTSRGFAGGAIYRLPPGGGPLTIVARLEPGHQPDT